MYYVEYYDNRARRYFYQIIVKNGENYELLPITRDKNKLVGLEKVVRKDSIIAALHDNGTKEITVDGDIYIVGSQLIPGAAVDAAKSFKDN